MARRLHRPRLRVRLATIVTIAAIGAGCPSSSPAPSPSAAAPPAADSPAPVEAAPSGPDAVSTPPIPAAPAPELGAVKPIPADLRWLAFAGGPTPDLNQVSLEQDLALVRASFGEHGYVLFGAGAGSASVQVLDPARTPDPVLAPLADLFAPRGGRDSRYRLPELEVDAPATATQVRAALTEAVTQTGPDLLVWVGGHGHQGETPADNATDLWGNGALTVDEMAEILDGARRTVRVVSTTCFGGGLGELAFRGADPTLGASTVTRCGVFAAPWDLEATGCDPNPDRTAQEGYALHVLHALRGEDRDGKSLPRVELDLDRDGAVSLLEAHTRARLAATSADVPTTTSERWLREVAPRRGDGREVALPEDEAVIRTLARRLGLDGREGEAQAELERREQRMEALGVALDEAQADEDVAFAGAAADLLARWPVLDDPWHPDFAPTLADQREAIAAHLRTSTSYRAYTEARAESDRRAGALWDLRAQTAPYERLARAVQTRSLAARLHAAGGPDWDHYAALLACERGTVP